LTPALTEIPQLILYEAACRALSEAKSVDEAKDFRNKAEAMRAYARQAKNKQMEIDASEIRFRAERRIGELMAAQRDAGLLANGGDAMRARVIKKPEESPPTLAEAGIDKNLADRARKYAAIPEQKFNDIVDDWRGRVEDENARVTANLLDAGGKAHVANNSGENEWYTPPEFIEAAREVLDGILLDPATSKKANETVRAEHIFTVEDNGLIQDWPIGSIWMNPPYAQPLIGQFANRFAAEIGRGSVGIVLVNNATETAWFQTIAATCSAICFPQSRIRFLDPNGNPGAPLQGQAIIYCGPYFDDFREAFGDFGLVVRHGV